MTSFKMRIIARIFTLSGSLFLSFVVPVADLYSQQPSTTNFHISGRLKGKDTGLVVLWFTNLANKLHADTARLDRGSFSFSGSVRGASEALLWTDLKNRNFDDPSVVRFILEPGNIHISKTATSRQRATINGSAAEAQKENWDDVKSVYADAEDSLYKAIDSLKKLSANQSSGQGLLDVLYRRIDSIRDIVVGMDACYIAQHSNSYLGGYLLSKRCRKLSLDSAILLYKGLADSVKNSSVGHEVLTYLYPLTNDSQFRSQNPLIDKAFNHRLANIKSVYDFRLMDKNGKLVDFRSFSGKYLLLDIWASWCGPCIKNIPAWNELKKTFSPTLIQFIGVSLDKDNERWKQSLAEHRPAGIQLIDTTAFSGLFSIYSKVLWVPRYIIVDPTGQIVNYDAPQPVEPDLQKLLDTLIKKDLTIY